MTPPRKPRLTAGGEGADWRLELGPDLAASVQAELHAMAVIANALIALKPPERARVLLICALKTAPNALTDSQIAELLRMAKES